MYYQTVSDIIKRVDLNYTSRILLLCLPARGSKLVHCEMAYIGVRW